MENLSKKTNNFVRGLKFSQRIYSDRYECYYTVEDGRIAASLSIYNPIDEALGMFPIDIKTSIRRKIDEQS